MVKKLMDVMWGSGRFVEKPKATASVGISLTLRRGFALFQGRPSYDTWFQADMYMGTNGGDTLFDR